MSMNEDLIYKEAGQALCKVLSGEGNIKTAIYQGNYYSRIGNIYALVAETLKRREVIASILQRTDFYDGCHSADINRSKRHFANACSDHSQVCEDCHSSVQVYDMLFGKGGYKCPLFLKCQLLSEILKKEMQKRGITDIKEFVNEEEVKLPIYVRVNTVLCTLEDAVDFLKSCQYKHCQYNSDDTTYTDFLHLVQKLPENNFMIDFHIENLLIFGINTQHLFNNGYMKKKFLITQDKASCIPAVILNPQVDSYVIDACAAPGNKTSQLAALVGRSGHVWALDKDRSRFKTMDRLLKFSGCVSNSFSRVTTMCDDFLTLKPIERLKNVTHILVDPSCSGSGITRDLDRALETNRPDKARLKSLSNIQSTLLRHALSFPNVEKVVYSTCSIYPEENENVVKENLERYKGIFQLENIWPESWTNRGRDGLHQCIRADPKTDLTTGFFVACFKRIAPTPSHLLSTEQGNRFAARPNNNRKENNVQNTEAKTSNKQMKWNKNNKNFNRPFRERAKKNPTRTVFSKEPMKDTLKHDPMKPSQSSQHENVTTALDYEPNDSITQPSEVKREFHSTSDEPQTQVLTKVEHNKEEVMKKEQKKKKQDGPAVVATKRKVVDEETTKQAATKKRKVIGENALESVLVETSSTNKKKKTKKKKNKNKKKRAQNKVDKPVGE